MYKTHNYWKYLDDMALYFHIVTNTFILYLAINIELSLFMAFNIACIVTFYVYASIRLNRRVKNEEAIQQSEITLTEAQRESKEFKR